MSIALDLGSHEFRSLRREGDHLSARRCRAAYCVLPATRQQQLLLDQAGIPYVWCAENLVLIGDAAVEHAETFQSPFRAVLPGGRFRRRDPLARQIAALLVESLLTTPTVSEPVCCMTVPGAPDAAGNHPELEFFTRVVRLQGYQPLLVHSGAAVVLAELGRCGFTGIGASFGATSTDISVSHRGVELSHCRIDCGGQAIDTEFARLGDDYRWNARGEPYLDVAAAERQKLWYSGCGGSGSGGSGQDDDYARIHDLYRDWLMHVVEEAGGVLGASLSPREVPQPLILVCAGGPVEFPGFRELLKDVLSKTRFPFAVNEILIAARPRYAAARGCLISAELEAGFGDRQAAA